MCTSIRYCNKNHYFGRTLDVDFSFREQVVITPRNYPFPLHCSKPFHTQTALIGMAAVIDDFPLYYEAANEHGLAMAGLNFPGQAKYLEEKEGMDNITPSEFIPWILGQAKTVREARAILERTNLVDVPFSPQLPLSPLHFMISDREEAIVVEPMADGLHIHENPFGVMTNNPPFDYHRWNMQQYLNLSPKNGENKFSPGYELQNYAVGMGAVGLPGDASSTSRFVRAAFNLANLHTDGDETDNVTGFFHVLDSVAMVKGAAIADSGRDDITLYSCCINADRGIYYYTTYGNSRITAVDLHRANPDGAALTCYSLRKEQDICPEN